MSSVGARLVEQLAHLGVREFFGVAGTEFSPVIERLAAGDLPLRCHTMPHEAVAVHMAAASALRSGRPVALMLHASIGTLNAAAALLSAQRLRAPLIVIAGRTPTDPHASHGGRDLFVHWGQEVFDQAAPVREFMKWDYELRRADDVCAILARAFEITSAPPRGPVYLSIPRELLLATTPAQLVDAPVPPTETTLPDSTITDLRAALSSAKAPLLIASEAGQDEETFNLLQDFIERFPVRALTPFAQTLCVPHTHPAFVPSSQGKLIAAADVILTLDCEVPWISAKAAPTPQAKVISVGTDVLRRSIPYPGLRYDIALPVSCKTFLRQVLSTATTKPAPLQRWGSGTAEATISTSTIASQGLSTTDVAAVIAKLWNDELILYNELALPVDGIPLKTWGSYYRTGSASCLGQILGHALGVALHDERRPLCVVGDGSYYFSNPLVFHWKARELGVSPITIILNNQGMDSILKNTAHLRSASLATTAPFISLTPTLEFSPLAAAFQGVGHRVTTLADFEQALSAALALRDAQVLIDVRIC